MLTLNKSHNILEKNQEVTTKLLYFVLAMCAKSCVDVKCGKIVEVTLGTLDIKSGPMRCWKGLWLQLICCTPFRPLSQDFRQGRWNIRDQRIRVKVGVVLRVELRGWVIKVRTYSIFELKYLHDKSKVFILIIRINKR